MASKDRWMHALNLLSLGIILFTGALESRNPHGGFLLWGYVVGILLTLMTNQRRYIATAFILSVVLILISFLQIQDEDSFESLLLSRAYGAVGLCITLLFVLVAVARERLSAKAKAQMTAIFSHGTQGIILTKIDGSIILVNPFTEKMFGYPSSELVQNKINLLIPDFLQVSKHHEIEIGNRVELIAHARNGQKFPVEISFNKYQSKDEYFLVAFVTDVTTRKKNEEMLHEKKNELENVNKELEAFSYSVSHDLRSPLRAVGGYAQMLEEDYSSLFDEEAKRLLENIQKSALRMGSLIDDLLTFSKLGKKEINKGYSDMAHIAQQALAELNQTSKHKAVVLIGPLHPAFSDSSLMSIVMVNLLSNAIKYSSKSNTPRIEVNSRIEHEDVIYSVRDNGVGFDMQYVHKLFGVFQRLHTENEFEGTGVGLATAQRIINKHGGRIWAEGEEGNGATFYFSIPNFQSTDQPNIHESKRESDAVYS